MADLNHLSDRDRLELQRSVYNDRLESELFPYGPLREIEFANGVVRYENDDLEYKLDGLFLTKGSTSLVTRYHSFGDHLNLLELNNDSVDPTKTQTFGYDAAQRLTFAATSGTYGFLAWTYDLVGNRKTEVRTPARSSTSTTSIFTYPTTSNLLTNVKQGSSTTRPATRSRTTGAAPPTLMSSTTPGGSRN